MVAKCCIKECRSEQYPGCEMTFHGFPSDEILKSKWIEATRVTGSVKYKRICPLHFKNEDFMIKGKAIRLKQDVIPTFCWPPFRKYSNDDKTIFKSSNNNYTTHNEDTMNEKDGENESTNIHLDRSSEDIQDSIYLETPSNDMQKIKRAGSISRCKCCLESDQLRNMWLEHCNGGLTEVYGAMLSECFGLHWIRPQNPKNSSDLICESCITRLRDAVSFKTEVLASEQLLSGQLEADVDKLKQERDDMDVMLTEYLHYKDLEDSTNNEEVDNSCDDDGTDIDKIYDIEENSIERDKEVSIKTEPHRTVNGTFKGSKKEAFRNNQIAMKLRKKRQSVRTVDALTNRANAAAKRFKISRKAISNALKNEDDLIQPVLKHISKADISIADLENITDNLRESGDSIENKKESEAIASTVYSIAQGTIPEEKDEVSKVVEWKEDQETKNNIKNSVVFIEIPKIIDDEKEDSKKTIAEIKKELTSKKMGSKTNETESGNNIKTPCENRLAEMKKQANNIAIILESTNATPIRRHGGIGYGCCFCNEEFPDAADLKQHTIKEHDIKTKRNYAKGKRPSAYLVKLDITGLRCNLCENYIDSLEQLYDHLTEIHKKLLYRSAKNYIVPFKFDQEELRCLFCEFICNSFKGLLEHMSVHYRNHICDICDAGFLTKNNLFNHAGRHKKGTFKCDYCPKVFDTSSKKAGHQRLVHSSTNGVNRCGYCGEMFGTYRRKEKHLITEHGITLKKLKCKACDKTFETQTGLRIHTKRDHLIERRFKCSVCEKRCFTNVQLKQHSLKHTGIKKFQCTICLKAYGRKSTLREHMRIHENDRRFKCELCGMAFVQKCSWRGHMLSKHGQQV